MSNPNVPDTSPSLLVALRDVRDAAAWQTFVQLYGPLIYRHARRHELQDADAADVAQDVLMEVARCIRAFEYQSAKGRFRGWLGLLTKRRVLRHKEKAGRAARGLGGDENDIAVEPQADAPDPAWNDDWYDALLRFALDRIRPHFEERTWKAFEETWLRQRPAVDVAGELGVLLENVYLSKSRVIRRLEDEIRYLAEDVPQI